jgi:hypothetical protein
MSIAPLTTAGEGRASGSTKVEIFRPTLTRSVETLAARGVPVAALSLFPEVRRLTHQRGVGAGTERGPASLLSSSSPPQGLHNRQSLIPQGSFRCLARFRILGVLRHEISAEPDPCKVARVIDGDVRQGIGADPDEQALVESVRDELATIIGAVRYSPAGGDELRDATALDEAAQRIGGLLRRLNARGLYLQAELRSDGASDAMRDIHAGDGGVGAPTVVLRAIRAQKAAA